MAYIKQYPTELERDVWHEATVRLNSLFDSAMTDSQQTKQADVRKVLDMVIISHPTRYLHFTAAEYAAHVNFWDCISRLGELIMHAHTNKLYSQWIHGYLFRFQHATKKTSSAAGRCSQTILYKPCWQPLKISIIDTHGVDHRAVCKMKQSCSVPTSKSLW